jgi:hypothetical protein
MRHKGCTKDGEIVYYCFHCGKVIDAPEVQAVLTAAEALTARVEYPESWYPEAQALFAAVHVLKEMEEKDE